METLQQNEYPMLSRNIGKMGQKTLYCSCYTLCWAQHRVIPIYMLHTIHAQHRE